MPRPKGSKNKKEVVEEVIVVDDLLNEEPEIEVKESNSEIVAVIKNKKNKKFIGRHPITKLEIWK